MPNTSHSQNNSSLEKDENLSIGREKLTNKKIASQRDLINKTRKMAIFEKEKRSVRF